MSQEVDSPKEAIQHAAETVSSLLPISYTAFQMSNEGTFATQPTSGQLQSGQGMAMDDAINTSPFGDLNLLNPATWPFGPLDMSLPEDSSDWLEAILSNSYTDDMPVRLDLDRADDSNSATI